MDQPKTYSETEAERFFAIKFFNQTWDLLDKPNRTTEEDNIMMDRAHASLAHWRTAGTSLHLQRGYWMLSRVHSVLNHTQPSLHYAQRCLDLTRQHPDLMQDFDIAFAYEAMARANAVAGETSQSNKFIKLAEKAGQAILDAEDRKVFIESFESGDWHGLK